VHQLGQGRSLQSCEEAIVPEISTEAKAAKLPRYDNEGASMFLAGPHRVALDPPDDTGLFVDREEMGIL